MITKEQEISDLTGEKYRKIFQDDGEKIKYTIDCHSFPEISPDMIKNADLRISKDKAVSWDFISDKVIHDLILKKYEDRILIGLCKLFNTWHQKLKIDQAFTTNRLLLLNKIANEIPHLEAIMPIAISGHILKLYEAIILNQLEDDMNVKSIKLNMNQTGFLKNLETGVNIIRLKEIALDTFRKPENALFYLSILCRLSIRFLINSYFHH